MATRIERHHASAFVIKEDQHSRSSRTLASGQWLQAGTVLEEADGSKVTAYVSGTIAGVLLNEANASLGDMLSPVLARAATVALDELTFPAESRDAVISGLLAKGIVSMFSPADTGGGGGGYVGPLDIVAGAVVGYSQRALSSALRGSGVYTIRRTSDNTSQTFESDPTTGEVDAAAIDAFIGSGSFDQTGAVTSGSNSITLVSASGVHVGQQLSGAGIPAPSYVTDISSAPTITISQNATASNAAEVLTFTQKGYVSSWIDQSGNLLSVVNMTEANQPWWENNSINDKPALRTGFDAPLGDQGPLRFLATASNVSLPNGEFTFIWVFTFPVGDVADTLMGMNSVAFDHDVMQIIQGVNSVWTFDFVTSAGEIYGSADSGLGPLTANPYITDTGMTSEAGDWCLNGTSYPLVYGQTQAAGAISNRLAIGADDPSGSDRFGWNGRIAEFLIYPTKLSDTDRLAIRQNIASYYGITLS